MRQPKKTPLANMNKNTQGGGAGLNHDAKSSTATSPAAPTGKIGLLVGLLCQPGGVTMAAMMSATGWQAHSVRGALSGSIKKARGLNVLSHNTDAGCIYRLTEEAVA